LTGTFLYLTATSLKNRMRRRVRRLREPRYLAGLVVGLLYFYWFVVRNQMRGARRAGDGLARIAPFAPDILAAGALALWCLALLAWLWPWAGRAWTFSGAEIQFFFTGPVSRRQLLNYKLLRSQLGLLFGVLIASVFTGAARAAMAGRWSYVLGGWLLFATMVLHVLGVTLTKSSFRAPASKVRWLPWLSAAVMAVVSGAVIGSYAVQAHVLMAKPLGEAIRAIVETSRTGVAAIALWPFGALIRPIFAETPMGFLRALGPAMAVLALNYWWVLESDAQLEDAAAAAEKRRARGPRGLPTPVVRPAPFALAPIGRLETAVLWKNTIQIGRYVSVATVVRVLLPIVVLASVIGLKHKGGSFAPLVLVVAFFLTVIGPYMIRNDLRMDLPRLSILKTWPISGRELLLGELLAPSIALSVAVWFLLAVAFALSASWDAWPGDAVSRASLAMSAALLAPVLIAGQLLIQNAAVVLFPGWITTGGARARGIEAMGQNMLMFAGTLFGLAVGVLPASAVAGGLGFVLYRVVGWPGALPAAGLFTGILLVEAGLVLTWLGRVLERTDPSHIEIAE
jgi:hypothetical protein